MYPTLSFFFQEVFGINIPLPVQTYGLMIAVGFIIGGILFSYEFKRKEKEGIFLAIYKKVKIGEPATVQNILISGLIGFLIGYKLVDAAMNYYEFVDNPQIFILSGRGSFGGGILIGILSAVYTWWDKNRRKLSSPTWEEQKIMPHELTGNLIVIAGISSILGAKLFHNLENFGALMRDPIGELLSFSGLSFLGGFIVTTVTVSIYIRKYNINILHTLDVGAVFLPMVYAIGRSGCHFSGDGCWGIPNPKPKPSFLSWLPDWLWAYDYPHNVLSEGVPMSDCNADKFCRHLEVPVFPTSLYEATSMLIFFIIVWSIRKKITTPGILFSIYLIFAGIERFFIEKIRVNNEYNIMGGITQAEIISFIMFLSGVFGLIYILKNKQKIIEYAKPKVKDINRSSLPKNKK